ncbi:MAG: YkgJ family cysteine cluster protein [Desulfuromonadaceae bacterium]|nr:YkgJ family cysteine cluster protein [Desulfuromonadaceae bacterium]
MSKYVCIDNGNSMECRVGCAACCIAPSISSPLPGMPGGKAAGVRCAHLTDDDRCRLFGTADRPPVCSSLQPSEEMCGDTAAEALQRLTCWERATCPETAHTSEIGT